MPSARKLRLVSASLALMTCCTACSSVQRPNSALVDRIKGRGPVVLSPTNPYLAANLLLSKEMQNCPELRGFIETRGAPAALEIEKPFFSALEMHFFYPENREAFYLEDLGGTWLIRGPEPIDSNKFRQVTKLTRGIDGQPQINTQSSSDEQLNEPLRAPLPHTIAPSQEEHQHEAAVVEELDYASAPQARLERAEARQKARESQEKSAAETPPTQVLSHKKQEEPAAGTEGKEDLAELSPKGDLVHYVTYSGESLSILARWYTGDRANAGRIARINQKTDANHLSMGDQVVIPSYLIKNKKRLTEKALHALMVIAREEKTK